MLPLDQLLQLIHNEQLLVKLNGINVNLFTATTFLITLRLRICCHEVRLSHKKGLRNFRIAPAALKLCFKHQKPRKVGLRLRLVISE